MVWVAVDRRLNTPLTKQIFHQLQSKILNGDLKAGQALPSTRQLAAELQVSRNVVLEVYEQLMAEGYLEARQGSGTFVAEGALLKHPLTFESLPDSIKHTGTKMTEDIVNFRSGIPALELFPRKHWARLAQQVLSDTPGRNFGYGSPEGRYELRSAIAKYLYRTRGVRCHPDQLVITSGATQAITLVAKLLVKPGDHIMIEDPITNDIQTIFTSCGARLIPLPVDHSGIAADRLVTGAYHGSVYVTPSHQYPLGSILPIQRRVQLIEYARNTGSYIVEDDYDSEFRYEGPPIHSLQSLDPSVVIYIGTFSKILSPALRIGYLILPYPLVERCRMLKWFSDLHTPSLEQLILARFIEEGFLERHIRQMKKVYKQRRNFLRKVLGQCFGDSVQVTGDSTGLHLIAEFTGIRFTNEVLEQMLGAGVSVHGVEMHAIQKGRHENRIILGYGNLEEQQIEKGISRIKHVLDNIRK
ncbi:HTH-type transcriptional regulatory protein gabR [Chlamydia abortus]|nr:HTH-type transcriptional regulatory protein gabR [Chlamydia abortus]